MPPQRFATARGIPIITGRLFGRICIWACLFGATAAQPAPGFLVVAPDRGFSGNEVVRDAFAPFAMERPARLVFVTSKGTEARLDAALLELERESAEPVVLLPFYLSAAHPDVKRVDAWREGKDVRRGRLFGHSVAAPAALKEALHPLHLSSSTRLVLVGHGAETRTQSRRMERDLARLLAVATGGISLASTETLVWPAVDDMDHDELEKQLGTLVTEGDIGDESARTVLLPFHLGPDLDSMMGFTPRLRYAAPEGIEIPAAVAGLEPAILRWLTRESTRHEMPAQGEIGVVVHAHGAGWQWNETMREGAAPLKAAYKVEYAFSMGDPATLEHAVRHLEERGAKAAVIVRVFGMADSFRDGIERFIGQTWEACRAPEPGEQAHGDGHGQGHGGGHGQEGHGDGHAAADAAPLLNTRLPVVTVGGLEDHPLFAEALYRRAQELSEQPGRETVILVAHGLGNEQGNAHWRKTLESLRDRILGLGGDEFRAIEVGLWSEDWPELRQSAVEHVRSLVEQGNRDGGRVLVIPARTLGEGPEHEYLEGLDYALGEGFAPHPLFADWLALQVRDGIDKLSYTSDADPACD